MKAATKKWYVGRVIRTDAGSPLYNTVDKNGLEANHTPTHDYKLAQAIVTRLNQVQSWK